MSAASDAGAALGAGLCVVMGAIMSGLQVGYFSLDSMKLQLLQMDPEADAKDKRRAKALIPLLNRHHWLLVTLLVVNAVAMETLPILLDHLVSPYIAIIMSVTLVLIAGEIIPQALCTNRPLLIGSFFAPLIRVLMWVTAPASYPIARLLDWILGDNGNHFLLKKSELHALVDLHSEGKGGHLMAEEVNIMKGALAFSERPVYEIMTPLHRCFMVELQRCLDLTLLNEIFKSGFSRIPVWDSRRPSVDNIVGLLIVKDLILLDPEDETPVSTILQYYPHPLERVFYDSHLKELLTIMRSGRAHMAVVHHINDAGPGDPFPVNLGIVTLEDVIESILQMQIEDESDVTMTAETGLTRAVGRDAMADRYWRRSLPQRLTPNEEVAVARFLTEKVEALMPHNRIISEAGLRALIRDSTMNDVKVKHSGLASPTAAAVASSALVLPTSPLPTSATPFVFSPPVASPPSPSALAALFRHELFSVDISQGGWSLYRRLEPSDFLTVIIDGSAEIQAGLEGFTMQVPAWAVLGGSALKGITASHVAEGRTRKAEGEQAPACEEGGQDATLPPFIPDFSAVLTSPSRVLRISRTAYLALVRKEAEEKVSVEQEQARKREKMEAAAAAATAARTAALSAAMTGQRNGYTGLKAAEARARRSSMPNVPQLAAGRTGTTADRTGKRVEVEMRRASRKEEPLLLHGGEAGHVAVVDVHCPVPTAADSGDDDVKEDVVRGTDVELGDRSSHAGHSQPTSRVQAPTGRMWPWAGQTSPSDYHRL